MSIAHTVQKQIVWWTTWLSISIQLCEEGTVCEFPCCFGKLTCCLVCLHCTYLLNLWTYVHLSEKHKNNVPFFFSHDSRFSVTKTSDNYHASFYLLVDNQRFAFKDAYLGSSHSTPSTSATISLQLKAGQVIKVENVSSNSVWGTDSDGAMLSWFTGHLLFPLWNV